MPARPEQLVALISANSKMMTENLGGTVTDAGGLVFAYGDTFAHLDEAGIPVRHSTDLTNESREEVDDRSKRMREQHATRLAYLMEAPDDELATQGLLGINVVYVNPAVPFEVDPRADRAAFNMLNAAAWGGKLVGSEPADIPVLQRESRLWTPVVMGMLAGKILRPYGQVSVDKGWELQTAYDRSRTNR